MLEDNGIDFDYHDYRKQPLTETEIKKVLAMLDAKPEELLRRRDRAFRELGLTGEEPDDVLIGHMAEHPTLLQRPIGIRGNRAVVGRPVENLLSLVD